MDDHLLRYKYLNEFDRAMMHLEEKYNWLESPQVCQLIIVLHGGISCKHKIVLHIYSLSAQKFGRHFKAGEEA